MWSDSCLLTLIACAKSVTNAVWHHSTSKQFFSRAENFSDNESAAVSKWKFCFYDSSISESVDDGTTVRHWCKREWEHSHTGWAPHTVSHSVTHRPAFGVNLDTLWRWLKRKQPTANIHKSTDHSTRVVLKSSVYVPLSHFSIASLWSVLVHKLFFQLRLFSQPQRSRSQNDPPVHTQHFWAH